MALVWNPRRGQLAGVQQRDQVDGVASVGLHPVAGAPRDQRRRDHIGGMTQRGDQTLETMAGWSSFVVEMHPLKLPGDPLDYTTPSS